MNTISCNPLEKVRHRRSKCMNCKINELSGKWLRQRRLQECRVTHFDGMTSSIPKWPPSVETCEAMTVAKVLEPPVGSCSLGFKVNTMVFFVASQNSDSKNAETESPQISFGFIASKWHHSLFKISKSLQRRSSLSQYQANCERYSLGDVRCCFKSSRILNNGIPSGFLPNVHAASIQAVMHAFLSRNPVQKSSADGAFPACTSAGLCFPIFSVSSMADSHRRRQ